MMQEPSADIHPLDHRDPSHVAVRPEPRHSAEDWRPCHLLTDLLDTEGGYLAPVLRWPASSRCDGGGVNDEG